MFKESAQSLTDLRTLCTAGVLLAMAVAIRTLSIEVTPDLRISFTFIPICAIAMLYGPVVCGASTVLLDLIGYIITNKSARAYSPQLALVVLLSGIVYGCFLYNMRFSTENKGKVTFISMLRIIGACASVALFCNIALNSYFIYTLYVNKDFSISDKSAWGGFLAYCSPRVVKNLIEFPIRAAVLCALLPAVRYAYDSVRSQFGHKKAQQS